MINRINQIFQLDITQQEYLNSFKPFTPGLWENRNLNHIKNHIHNQLLLIQNNKCAFCGLAVNEGGRAELDHIAKKGGLKRPAYIEFTFTPHNLVICCQYCNSSSKKGQIDVLNNIDLTNYNNCTFKLVHPYFDNPDNHFSWSTGEFEILISSTSPQGMFSIDLFDLASEAHTTARAKQIMFEKKLAKYNNRQQIKQRVLDILNFKF